MFRLSFASVFFLCLAAFAWSRPVPNVAVLTFTGDKTVSTEQLQFITGKFSAYLVESGAFTVLERARMDDILKEQGFQQSGACNNSECRVQVGQLLGVDNLIAGSLVRFGDEYAFRIEYLDVASGRIIKTIEFEKTGELQDVYKGACRTGAEELIRYLDKDNLTSTAVDTNSKAKPVAFLDPPTGQKGLSWKRKIALGLLGTSVLGGARGLYYNNKVTQYVREYKSAEESQSSADLERSYKNWQSAKDTRANSYGFAGISALVAAILWFLPEGK